MFFKIAGNTAPIYAAIVRGKKANNMIVGKTNNKVIRIFRIDRDAGNKSIVRKNRTGNIGGRWGSTIYLIDTKEMSIARAVKKLMLRNDRKRKRGNQSWIAHRCIIQRIPN